MTKHIILGIVIGISVVLAAVILTNGYGKIANGFGTIAQGFGTIAKPDRIVSVRGLAEREVDADLAVWPLSFSLGGDSLQDLQTDIVNKIAIATDYLKKYGLAETDYTVQAPSLTDTTLVTYSNDKAPYHYIAKQVILVRSKNVIAVKNAQEHSLDLMGQNIAVERDYDSKVLYDYTSLNDIKPEMIGEATKNARAAAEQFASDSGSSVGKIKTATQGWFSIEDAAPGLEERKKVRVVTTVEYILTD